MGFGVVLGKGRMGAGYQVSPRWQGVASCSVGAEGGDVHACHKQLVVINLGSRESDAGNNLTGLSAKMTWV